MTITATPQIRMFNRDSMKAMAEIEDNTYDLAIVDPPYGILSKAGNILDKYGTKHKEWDSSTPETKYFQELERVSKNRIIWGANNYWADKLPNTTNYVFWYKHQPLKNWAAGELAWTSFKGPAKCFDYMCYGGVNGDKNRIHPTQKPVRLYKWLLKEYANDGDKILDTHGGSGSIAIACWEMGFDLDWYEIDADYYSDAVERFKNHISQTSLFHPSNKTANKQQDLMETKQ